MKIKKAYLIKSNGIISEVKPEKKKFSLDELHALVDGDIQLIRLDDRSFMVCNENGINDNLPVNQKATDRLPANYLSNLFMGIRGDVVICDPGLI